MRVHSSTAQTVFVCAGRHSRVKEGLWDIDPCFFIKQCLFCQCVQKERETEHARREGARRAACVNSRSSFFWTLVFICGLLGGWRPVAAQEKRAAGLYACEQHAARQTNATHAQQACARRADLIYKLPTYIILWRA